MQMTTEARAWLDDMVRRVLARHPVRDPERAGVTYELMSHVHGAAERKAAEAGRDVIDVDHVRTAVLDMGGEDELARAFVQPVAAPVERVLFWRRAGAFAIDVGVILIALAVVHRLVEALLMPFYPTWVSTPHDDSLWGLFPWGFHDSALPGPVQALIAVASAALVMTYFTWTEGTEGRSLGKRALGLRVVRVDGAPMTPREGFLRNLAKLQPFILILDTLIMLLAFRQEKQRVSDRVADTIVVRA